MKGVAALLMLMLSALAQAQIETWSFQGANLYADPGPDALITGPAGLLTGHFDYDTSTNTITSFELNAGGAILSSEFPEIAECPFTPCTGKALVHTPSQLVFDKNFTPASNQRLELFLSAPLDTAHGPIALDPQSVVSYNGGYATIHVLGGSLVPQTFAISTPEPASVAMMVVGLGVAAVVAGRRRVQLSE